MAIAKAPTRTNGTTTWSRSWESPVSASRTADTISCPGLAPVSRGPSPTCATKSARHTYQGVSHPSGSEKCRTRYTRKYRRKAPKNREPAAATGQAQRINARPRDGLPGDPATCDAGAVLTTPR